MVSVFTRGDFPEKADIITLVEYIKDLYFVNAMYWICQICGYDYYYTEKIIDDPCLAFLKQVEPKGLDLEEELQKYDESILETCPIYPNLKFLKDNISTRTQNEFGIGYNTNEQRITIPIRDEVGSLVGIKGRTIIENYKKLDIPKYRYLLSAPKSHLLYGLHKSYPYIKETGQAVVYEAEKSMMASWSMGVKNCVSIGGHKLSLIQVMKLEKLGVDIILAFDKGLTRTDIKDEGKKFIIKNKVYGLWDKENLLKDKQSPTDVDKEVFLHLLNNHKYKIK